MRWAQDLAFRSSLIEACAEALPTKESLANDWGGSGLRGRVEPVAEARNAEGASGAELLIPSPQC